MGNVHGGGRKSPESKLQIQRSKLQRNLNEQAPRGTPSSSILLPVEVRRPREKEEGVSDGFEGEDDYLGKNNVCIRRCVDTEKGEKHQIYNLLIIRS
jgi:hypothetical protein